LAGPERPGSRSAEKKRGLYGQTIVSSKKLTDGNRAQDVFADP